MTFRKPVNLDVSFFDRVLDPSATGLLRVDTPDYWKSGVPALRNLSVSPILYAFDELAVENKYIVARVVKHVVDILRRSYLRKEPPKDSVRQQLGRGVFYVATDDLWQEMVRLARVPEANKGAVTHAFLEYDRLWNAAMTDGRLVYGVAFEALLEASQDYLEDITLTILRRPVVDTAALDRDHMHAFLCAYDSCFPS
jgi:hypothetical protein